MKRTSTFLCLVLSTLGLCLVLGAGCGGAAGTCSYDGKSYHSGDSFPSSDGCNTCACGGDGQVLCTERACEAIQCTYDGKTYRAGESFPSTDGCNACACQSDGRVVCTLRACQAQCSYDGKKYNVGDTFPASDGCNTCTCSQNGAVGCTKIACAATQWLSLRPVQCQGNPWQKGTPKGDGTEPNYPVPELLTIDRFFRDQGIRLQELGLLDMVMLGGVCDACSCPRGDRLVVRARSSDVDKLGKSYGFAAVTEDVKTSEPLQCDANPWKPGDSPRTEAHNVATWASSIGATLNEVGFAYQTRAVPVCLACNCPRGDRLITYPKDAAASAVLTQQGFVPLP